MTPHTALAAIGAISLFVVTVRLILAGLIRLTDERRAYRATRFLVGRAYWSPNMVISNHSAAGAKR